MKITCTTLHFILFITLYFVNLSYSKIVETTSEVNNNSQKRFARSRNSPYYNYQPIPLSAGFNSNRYRKVNNNRAQYAPSIKRRQYSQTKNNPRKNFKIYPVFPGK